jgi:3-hydroxyacyl-CoA dehydrogenase/enoyl-CoA hydratase/3-hydroxybutyryl-CoA epimerase
MSQHIHRQIDDNHIAWLAFDKADSSANVLSEDVLQAFDTQLIALSKQNLAGLVIYSAKANGFIAGADVHAFARVKDTQQAIAHIQQVHQIFQRLDDLPFPTLAMIKGFCLGGGLELALACDYRIACDVPNTRIGLPEVKLGIFPGYGGTLRCPRVIGHLPALRMMLSGRTFNARQARKAKLVDYALPERELRHAAEKMILQKPKPQQAHGLLDKLMQVAPLRKAFAAYMRKELQKKVNQQHYPAPFALLTHWQQYADDPTRLLQSEAENVAKLITGDTAQQLIRVFLLQDRLKSLGDKNAFQVKHIHVIGGGVMGGDIAAWCALRGLRVTLQDREPELLSHAIARANTLFKRKLKNPYWIQQAQDRFIPDYQGHGVSQADLVIEAIFENLEAKRALYAQIEPQLKPGALLASNTSSIPLQELVAQLKQPKRFVGLHFFNPVAKMPLLEIVHTTDTDPTALQQALAFARHIDKLPLPVKSSPGFLVNRVLMPYLLEAVQLLEAGEDKAAIDQAALDFGMPMGPIELADTVGLDVCLSVAQKMADVLHSQVPERLVRLVKNKNLGKKSGQGFYAWDKTGRVKKSPAKPSRPDLAERMIKRLADEAEACLNEGVVSDADLLDAGIIFGTGFAPFRGGPMQYQRALRE